MGKIALLREFELGPAFRKAVRKGGQINIAVPFWGTGAIKTLGLSKDDSVRIICNLYHPGCNPDVIADLIDLGLDVRMHRRLHAKVYATPHVAFVGSSNVSSNGLTAEGREASGWIEANVMNDEPSFVRDVNALFDTLWRDRTNTKRISPADIAAAKKAREALPAMLIDLPPRTSLFDAVRAKPEAFSSVYVAAYSEDMSPKAREKFKKVKQETAAPDAGLGVPDFKNAHGYQFAHIPANAWLIGIDCRKPEEPRFWGCAQASGPKLKVEGEYDLAIALRGLIRVGERTFRISAEEKRLLFGASKKIMRKSQDNLMRLSEAVKLVG